MTVGQALVEFLAHQWTVDGDHRERTIPGIVRHLRPRQRRRRRPGAQAARRRAARPDAVPPGPQRAGHGAPGRRLRAHAPAARARSRAPPPSGPAPPTCSPAPRSRPRTGCPRCCCRATRSPPASPTPCCSSSSCRTTPASRSPTRSARCRGSSTASQRPEQLYSIALAAMRVLTDPAETGAVTIALPEDVQAEALDVPVEFLATARVAHPPPAARARPARARRRGDPRREAAAHRRRRRRALLRRRGRAARARRADRHPGRHHPGRRRLARLGPPAVPRRRRRDRHAPPRTALAAEADLVIGIGTRYSDFTTASRTAFQDPDVQLRQRQRRVVRRLQARHAAAGDRGRPRGARRALRAELAGYRVDADYAERIGRARSAEWDAVVDARARAHRGWRCPGQPEIIGAVQAATDPRDVRRAGRRLAAGRPAQALARARRRSATTSSTPSRAWATRSPAGSASSAARRGDDRDVIVMVGDGSYLMLHTELVTAVAEGIKIIVVLIQNQGYASIGHLSETVGSRAVRHPYRRSTRRRGLRRRRAAARRPGGERPQLRRRRHRGRARAGRGRRAGARPSRRAKASDDRDADPHRAATRSSTRPTARAGGTCRSPRSRPWPARRRAHDEYVDAAAAAPAARLTPRAASRALTRVHQGSACSSIGASRSARSPHGSGRFSFPGASDEV